MQFLDWSKSLVQTQAAYYLEEISEHLEDPGLITNHVVMWRVFADVAAAANICLLVLTYKCQKGANWALELEGWCSANRSTGLIFHRFSKSHLLMLLACFFDGEGN